MVVETKKIFQEFLNKYVHIHLEIRKNQHGLETTNSLYSDSGKYTLSHKSMTITRWFNGNEGKDFEEFQIEKDKGKILITQANKDFNTKKVLVEFNHPTEPLNLTFSK